jgi:hypothetical protein
VPNKPSVPLIADLPPPADISLVFLQRFRKGVAAISIGDEVQIIGVGRLQHRLQGGTSGISDRRGR